MEAEMNNSEFINDGAFGFQLSGSEMRLVARRQLIASVAVVIVIVLGVGLNALMPAAHRYVAAAPHKAVTVQQAKFAVRAEHVAAAMQNGVELP
jgi:hypothetical protein